MAQRSQASRRYALALVDAVTRSNEVPLERAVEELKKFADAMETSFDLKNTLLNPVFSAPERERVVNTVLESLAFSEILRRFIRMLVTKKRVRDIRAIAEAFQDLADERRGRVRAVVESASPLSSESSDRLRRVLEKATGKSIDLETHVDPALIGGLRARVGSLVFDGTIRAELGRFKQALVGEELAGANLKATHG